MEIVLTAEPFEIYILKVCAPDQLAEILHGRLVGGDGDQDDGLADDLVVGGRYGGHSCLSPRLHYRSTTTFLRSSPPLWHCRCYGGEDRRAEMPAVWQLKRLAATAAAIPAAAQGSAAPRRFSDKFGLYHSWV